MLNFFLSKEFRLCSPEQHLSLIFIERFMFFKNNFSTNINTYFTINYFLSCKPNDIIYRYELSGIDHFQFPFRQFRDYTVSIARQALFSVTHSLT